MAKPRKPTRAEVPADPADAEITRRYRALLAVLAERAGRPVRGWQARVARDLGVDPTYVSKIARGERSRVGARAIEKAMAPPLNIPRDYFFGETRQDPHRVVGPKTWDVDVAVEWRDGEQFLPIALVLLHRARAARDAGATSDAEIAEQYRRLARAVTELLPELVLARRVLDAADLEAIAAGERLAERIADKIHRALDGRGNPDQA